APGIYLVELPFESKSVLVDLRSRSAILLMRSEVTRSKSKSGDDVILIDQRSALDTSSYTLRSGERAFDFQTDISSVHVDLPPPASGTKSGEARKADVAPTGQPTATPAASGVTIVPEPPAPRTPSVSDSDAARACVRIESVPTALTPGCTRTVIARNSCDRPV